MRLIIYLAALVLTVTGCKCQKNATESSAMKTNAQTAQANVENEVPTMVYDASSRNYFLKIKIENQKISIVNTRNKNSHTIENSISNEDWKSITDLAKKVALEKVKDFKAPTEKRLYDGAAHANITFVLNETEYRTLGFDHGHPPVEIEALVNKIVALQKELTKE